MSWVSKVLIFHKCASYISATFDVDCCVFANFILLVVWVTLAALRHCVRIQRLRVVSASIQHQAERLH
jgi:hypothetical protein